MNYNEIFKVLANCDNGIADYLHFCSGIDKENRAREGVITAVKKVEKNNESLI